MQLVNKLKKAMK